jgi:hypothetical protein
MKSVSKPPIKAYGKVYIKLFINLSTRGVRQVYTSCFINLYTRGVRQGRGVCYLYLKVYGKVCYLCRYIITNRCLSAVPKSLPSCLLMTIFTRSVRESLTPVFLWGHSSREPVSKRAFRA